MLVIRSVTIPEIERDLLAMGGGNHKDNMEVISRFPEHYVVELSEDEFFSLVFLQVRELSIICPPGEDRTLRAVATRAIASSQRKLGENWDLDVIENRTREFLHSTSTQLAPLFLRDAHDSECRHGSWYLQDGCHRGLGYAMAVVSGSIGYSPATAICSTERDLQQRRDKG
jgi:hypothetical protein